MACWLLESHVDRPGTFSSEHFTKSRNTLNHMASYLLVLDDAMKSLADGTPLKIHEADMPLFVAVSVPVSA